MRSKSLLKVLGAPCLLIVSLLLLAGCGSSNNSPTTSTGPVSNTAQLVANLGPQNEIVNGIFIDITVCQHGTTNCQPVNNVLVDTGSIGLRLVQGALGSVTPSQILPNGSPLLECIQYGDTSYSWGPMALADVQIAGEKASNIPIQLLGGTGTPNAAPSSCFTVGTPNSNLPGTPPGNEDTLQSLGANGILGIAGNNTTADGEGIVDCGSYCANNLSFNPYYTCPSGNCTQVLVSTSFQAANPVAAFSSTDKNGVMITFPSVPATGATTLSGTMNFGIGTQSDNALGNATVFSMDACGSLPTITFNGVQYTDTNCQGTGSGLGGFFDTGSTVLFVLDSNTLHSFNNNIADCTASNEAGLYCVSGGGTVPLPISIQGNGVGSANISLNIMDANALFTTNNSVFNDLGGDSVTTNPGPLTDFFDFGSPVFFGRTVFIGIGGVTGVDSNIAPAGFVAF